ncbi:MAG: ParA family protein [Chloroflexi bacterium]|nr:MAG: ParA family protein [Chloroflexota bacterium]
MNPPTVIAVNNHKGGVAKTTTCLSLGACLAELGQTVLLVDLDPQAHLTLSLGIEPDSLRRTVGDSLLGSGTLTGISRETPVLGLDIAPANRELALIDKLLYSRPGYEQQLRRQLQAIPAASYDLILLDCSPAMNTLTLNAITAADLLLIPAQAEYYAARSLRQVVRLVALVRRKTNPTLDFRFLVTMYDRRNKVSRLLLAQMQRDLQPRLFETVIGIDTKLRESPAFAQPITQYAPKTRAAQQYRALAKELMTYVRQKSARPARGAVLRAG